ncbi:F-box protein At5g52880-like isoform X2 [Apium graveolens]|uniref:F-box protein At5g52880-like isoform X2 n=1 Tax=Apium graveolens TaxID=4045 RepID=UPI003D7AB1BE
MSLLMGRFGHTRRTQLVSWAGPRICLGTIQLPGDVLIHIFSFLYLRSLVVAVSVNRSWNLAASDNRLWQLQHSIYFVDSDTLYEIKILQAQT